MIDSHVHLNRARIRAPTATRSWPRARAAGVTGFLNVGYDLPSSRESIALAEDDPAIWATVGVHPHDAAVAGRRRGAASPPRGASPGRAGGAGGTPPGGGHRARSAWISSATSRRGRPSGRPWRPSSTGAAQLDLPVVFHVRDAWHEILACIDEVGVPPAGRRAARLRRRRGGGDLGPGTRLSAGHRRSGDL